MHRSSFANYINEEKIKRQEITLHKWQEEESKSNCEAGVAGKQTVRLKLSESGEMNKTLECFICN